MPADLLAGRSGTEWNPKDPVALITDYRCCSEGMWRDQMEPDGRPLGLLITQRSRVQIPPPPPLGPGHSPPARMPCRRSRGPMLTACSRGRRRPIAEDQAGHCLRRLLVQARQHVRVGIQRDLNGGVAQALADHLGRDASRQRRVCVAVAHVMQPDLRQPRLTSQPPEPVGDQIRMDRGTVRAGETKPESCQSGPTTARSSAWRSWWSRSAATVTASSATERRPLAVFGSDASTA
jgi:hypothetical protein